MKSRVLNSSYVINFELNEKEITNQVRLEVDSVLEAFDDPKLTDWYLYFRFRYNNCKGILISLSSRSIPKERFREIIIHIPVPTNDKVPWGVDKEQHVYQDENHLDHMIDNFSVLEVDIYKFTNRNDYVLDCMQRTVKFCFEHGFTVNGKKIKVNSTP
jgi:hypothetical protein